MGDCLFMYRGAPPSIAPCLGDYDPGTLISIGENGVQIPFLLLIHDYPAQGRSLLIRQNCFSAGRSWGSSGDFYFESTADTYCDNDYYNTLEDIVKNQIEAVDIQSYVDYFALQTINRKCFLLSATELGGTGMDVEGSAIPYFNSNQSRISIQDGTTTARVWLTRTNENTTTIWGVRNTGVIDDYSKTSYYYFRPAFTLPSDFEPTLWEG